MSDYVEKIDIEGEQWDFKDSPLTEVVEEAKEKMFIDYESRVSTTLGKQESTTNRQWGTKTFDKDGAFSFFCYTSSSTRIVFGMTVTINEVAVFTSTREGTSSIREQSPIMRVKKGDSIQLALFGMSGVSSSNAITIYYHEYGFRA